MPDVERSWSRWLEVLSADGYAAHAMVRPPARDEDVTHAEAMSGMRFPDELRALYALSDGQWATDERAPRLQTSLLPAFYELLPVTTALRRWTQYSRLQAEHPQMVWEFDAKAAVPDVDPVRPVFWDVAGWWPLAEDPRGHNLAVDARPLAGGTVGQVIVAGPKDDERLRIATGVADLWDRLASSPLTELDPEEDDDVRMWEVPWLTVL